MIGGIALVEAIKYGCVEVVKLLIEKNVNLNKRYPSYYNDSNLFYDYIFPLILAINTKLENTTKVLVKILLEAGASTYCNLKKDIDSVYFVNYKINNYKLIIKTQPDLSKLHEKISFFYNDKFHKNENKKSYEEAITYKPIFEDILQLLQKARKNEKGNIKSKLNSEEKRSFDAIPPKFGY